MPSTSQKRMQKSRRRKNEGNMLMRAKVHHASLDIMIEGEEDPNEKETVEVGYWVGEDESFDQIKLDGGPIDEGMHPHLAVVVAKMIVKLEKWAKTKVGKKDIERMREKVQKAMDE